MAKAKKRPAATRHRQDTGGSPSKNNVEEVEKEEIIVRQARDIEDRNRRISVLEGRLQELALAHKYEIAQSHEEQQGQKTETEYKSRLHELEISRLQENLQAFNGVEERNRNLNATISRLQNEISRQREKYEDLILALKGNNEAIRKELEAAFRVKMGEVQARSKELALEEISKDSRDAIVQNQRLAVELQEKHRSVEQILHRFDRLNNAFLRTKSDKEIAQASLQHAVEDQMKWKMDCNNWKQRFLVAEEKNRVSEAKIAELEAQIKTLRMQNKRGQTSSKTRTIRSSSALTDTSNRLTSPFPSQRRQRPPSNAKTLDSDSSDDEKQALALLSIWNSRYSIPMQKDHGGRKDVVSGIRSKSASRALIFHP